MTESKHTPGPWRQGIPGTVVCDTPTGHDGHGATDYYGGHLVAESIASPADAALIARAPDLLRENESLRTQNAELLGLLERVKDEKGFTCDCGISEEVFDGMDTAIAKAKGGVA